MGEGEECSVISETMEKGGYEVKRAPRVEEDEDVCFYQAVISCGGDEDVIQSVLDVYSLALENDCQAPRIIALADDPNVRVILERLGADVVLPVNAVARIAASIATYPYAGLLLLNAMKGELKVASKECLNSEGCDAFTLAGEKGIPIAVLSRGRWMPPSTNLKPGDIVVYFVVG
ncbi:hypothetical protein Igni_0833 [Ignicoccus hospitalis KIN4/I]|uniref:RCK N-terminal domain-containing protein n=1 Tax=Ignicoccus hospitalis (strain KIN4/I / DSM 18386 / JCM 14125) TaxID=453591 RepID=A8AAR3_IGNH4|nr:hypothetical protein Igni_0833 [Ignicoccus hospitalis KIN4/I]